MLNHTFVNIGELMYVFSEDTVTQMQNDGDKGSCPRARDRPPSRGNVQLPALPTEMLEKVFSYLEYNDLITTRRVCKEWQGAQTDDQLKKSMSIMIRRMLRETQGWPNPRMTCMALTLVKQGYLDAEELHRKLEEGGGEEPNGRGGMKWLGLDPHPISELRFASLMISMNVLSKIDLLYLKPEVLSQGGLTLLELTTLLRAVKYDVRVIKRPLDPQLIPHVGGEIDFHDTKFNDTCMMALVEGMKNAFQSLKLTGDIHIDFGTLIERYPGNGRCRRIWIQGPAFLRYRSYLISWAHKMHWNCYEYTGNGSENSCLVAFSPTAHEIPIIRQGL